MIDKKCEYCSTVIKHGVCDCDAQDLKIVCQEMRGMVETVRSKYNAMASVLKSLRVTADVDENGTRLVPTDNEGGAK